jgi:predicted nucleic acid-binding protein
LGLDRLSAFLRRHTRIALDTSVFIYQLEANPRYVPFTGRIFAWLQQPEPKAVTSSITMTELLVAPYRASDEELVDVFHGLLSTYPNLDWVAPDLAIADLAARLRAAHGLKTPDALQAATALQARASGMITNDSVFQRVAGFETLILDRLR